MAARRYMQGEKARQNEGFYDENDRSSGDNYGLNFRNAHMNNNIPSHQRGIVSLGDKSREEFVNAREANGSDTFAELDIDPDMLQYNMDRNNHEDVLQQARTDPEMRKKLYTRQLPKARSLYFDSAPKPIPKKRATLAKPWVISQPIDSAQAQHDYSAKTISENRPDNWVSEPRGPKHRREKEFQLPSDLDQTLKDQFHQQVNIHDNRVVLQTQRPERLPNPDKRYPPDFNPNSLNYKPKETTNNKILNHPDYYERNKWKPDAVQIEPNTPISMGLREGQGRANAGPISLDGFEKDMRAFKVDSRGQTFTEPEYVDGQDVPDEWDYDRVHVGDRPGKTFTLREYQDKMQQLQAERELPKSAQGRIRDQTLYNDPEYYDGNDQQIPIDDRYAPSPYNNMKISHRDDQQYQDASFDYANYTHVPSRRTGYHNTKTTLKDHHMSNPDQGYIIEVPKQDDADYSRGYSYQDRDHADPVETYPTSMTVARRTLPITNEGNAYREVSYREPLSEGAHYDENPNLRKPMTMGQIYGEIGTRDNNQDRISESDRNRHGLRNRSAITYSEREYDDADDNSNIGEVPNKSRPTSMGAMLTQLENSDGKAQQSDLEVEKRRPLKIMGLMYSDNENNDNSRNTGQVRGTDMPVSRHLGKNLKVTEGRLRDPSIPNHPETDQRGPEPRITIVKKGRDRTVAMEYDKTIEDPHANERQLERTQFRGLKQKQPRGPLVLGKPDQYKEPYGYQELTPVSRSTMKNKKYQSPLVNQTQRDSREELDRIKQYSKQLGIPKFH